MLGADSEEREPMGPAIGFFGESEKFLALVRSFWQSEWASALASGGRLDIEAIIAVHIEASIMGPATPNGLFHQGKRPKRPSHKGLEKSGLDAELPQVADAVIRALCQTGGPVIS
jgi:hypothetical protein